MALWAAPFRPTTQDFQTGFGEERRIALEGGSLVMLVDTEPDRIVIKPRKAERLDDGGI